MARAFRVEDGHPLDSTDEAAVVQIGGGEPSARAWSSGREPPPLPTISSGGIRS